MVNPLVEYCLKCSLALPLLKVMLQMFIGFTTSENTAKAVVWRATRENTAEGVHWFRHSRKYCFRFSLLSPFVEILLLVFIDFATRDNTDLGAHWLCHTRQDCLKAPLLYQ